MQHVYPVRDIATFASIFGPTLRDFRLSRIFFFMIYRSACNIGVALRAELLVQLKPHHLSRLRALAQGRKGGGMLRVLKRWIHHRRHLRRRWQDDARRPLAAMGSNSYYEAQRRAARGRVYGDRDEFYHCEGRRRNRPHVASGEHGSRSCPTHRQRGKPSGTIVGTPCRQAAKLVIQGRGVEMAEVKNRLGKASLTCDLAPKTRCHSPLSLA